MKRKKGKDKLSKKINRFKLKVGVILLSVSLTVFSIVLIVTMISNLICSAAAIIFSSTNQITFLYCDGTYSNNNVNVHIWSDESISSTASGTSTSNNKKIKEGHYVGQATTGEHGTRNNKAGDQSGKEVAISKWYKNSSFGNWNYVVRAKDPNKAAIMAQQMENCCNNNHIGYDQADRKTLYKEASKVGWDCSRIKTNCETTCTEVLVVCATAAGIKIPKAGTKAIYCGNVIKKLKSTNQFYFYTTNDYTKSYKKLRRGDFIINTGHHSCMYLSGSTGNLPPNSEIYSKDDNAPATAATNNSIDFTVESSKIIGKRFELIKSNLSDGISTGALNASLIIDEKNNRFEISGTLCGNTIILNGNATDGKLNGDGYYGSITGEFNGNITLSGAELKASTPIQLKIAQIASGYVNPYNNGWHGLCEAWVGDVYRRCGLYYAGSCCASRSKIKNASNSSGKSIPVGAAIYSGSNYKSNITCECGLNAGHVAIYIGNNKVAGSQSQYIMSLQAWTNYFGYGGWYLPNN